MKYFARTGLVFMAGAAFVAAPDSAIAQVPAGAPPPAQAAAVLQSAVAANPGIADVIRQRLTSSGMTPDQIRARLQAAGYPSNLLDAYLGPATPGQAPTPGLQEAGAIQALGLPPVTIDVGRIPVDTGLVTAVQATAAPASPTNIFGVDIFKRTTTQFMPSLTGPVPPDYQLGPGDDLVLILTGDVEQTYTLPVTREGFILIPSVGQVHVANLTLSQLRDVLYTRLGRVYSGVRRTGATTQFDVTVANVRAVQVYVVGEVAQPGAYQLSSLSTVLTALYAAGGLTDRANTRRIEVRRDGRSAGTLDLYDYVLRGDTRNDIRLESGDVIFVGLHGPRVSIRGAVPRSALFELTDRETLTDLVADAGGLLPNAALQRISVTRTVPPSRRTPTGPQNVVVDVPIPRGAGPDGQAVVPPFPLENSDAVFVDTISSAQRNFVDISGNVFQPGRFAFEPGMKLSRLVTLAAGLKPATYAGRAHILRLHRADMRSQLISVALPADTLSPWPDDIALQDADVVMIFGREEMREDITVGVAGMVNNPGPYPWHQGMTLRDLLLDAHGPKIGADLRLAEVARLPADRSQGQLAITVRVPLDSTYLFDRDSLGRYIGPPGVAFPAGGSPEVPLEPYDNVLIMRQPGFEYMRNVTIEGQVMHPGTYSLTSRDERLVDLIGRAGGMTPLAYAEGVHFVRTLGNAGRIDIDLPRAMKDRESRDNIILAANDTVFIPEFQPSVRVIGAVNSPGSVLWHSGKSLGYYLGAAGGTSRLAVDNRASVRQPNGRVETRHRFLFWHRDPTPGPGSEILVPARDPSDKTDWLGIFASTAQILTSTITLLVVAKRL